MNEDDVKSQTNRGAKRDRTRKLRKEREPKDYGITKGQFYAVLDKASQPRKPETESKNS